MRMIQIGHMLFPERAERGWFFNEVEGWDGATDNKNGATEKPDGHGSFTRTRVRRSSRPMSVKVGFLGACREDMIFARNELSALGAEGPVLMTVMGEDGPSSRIVTVEHSDLPDWHGRLRVDDLAIDLLADDPRRYGTPVTDETGLPQLGTGLVWPMVYPLDWGLPGDPGRLVLQNTGSAPAFPILRAYGGFTTATLTDVGTGRRLILDRPVPVGQWAEFNARTEQVLLNGESAVPAMYLTSREWWSVPPGGRVEIQFNATGADGTPVLMGELRPTWW